MADRFSSGERRPAENGQGCAEMARVKVEISPFKENTLKACQMLVNGTHNDNQDTDYNRSAKEIMLENSLRSNNLCSDTKAIQMCILFWAASNGTHTFPYF